MPRSTLVLSITTMSMNWCCLAGRSANGLAHFAFTSSGTLVYVPTEKQGSSSLFWLDPAGGPKVMQTSQDFYQEPRISPEGSRHRQGRFRSHAQRQAHPRSYA